MSSIRSISDVPLSRKVIILRLDLNLPISHNEDGSYNILDKNRICVSIKTIKYLMDLDTKVVICSHLGSPKNQDIKFSMKIIAQNLSEELEQEIIFFDKHESNIKNIIDNSPYGSLFMLENLRFDSGEESNSDAFAQYLASLGNVYINDAFASCHRKHASIHAITKFLPSFAGFNLQKEVSILDDLLLNAKKRDILAIVGGGKVSSKIGILKTLVKECSNIAIGGAMANTFLYAQGYDIGSSYAERDLKNVALDILASAKSNNCTIILPENVIVAKIIKAGANITNKSIKNTLDIDDNIVDLGLEFVQKILKLAEKMKYIFVNGPIGMYEVKPFDISSLLLYRELGRITQNCGVNTIIGGGDAVACANLAGARESITFISSGGGAFLEYIENLSLPCIDILRGEILL